MGQIITGHVPDALKVLADNSVDTVVTDPPYELGFMGKKWDKSGVAFRPETWAEILRVAKPGTMLLAFGGTRTYHRLTCTIEDAGWKIRDCIMWLYGSGFPKSLDISKAIDAEVCREELTLKLGRAPTREEFKTTWATFRKAIGEIRRWGNAAGKGRGAQYANDYEASEIGAERFDPITQPSTVLAQLWDGWGTALKPAYEPIVLAMKPLDGTFRRTPRNGAWRVCGLMGGE